MLHPLDSFTGYTLHKGELVYNQAIAPWPTWMWWGITDRITAELDIECWLGGVLSFNFRFGSGKQQGKCFSIAYETMFQYLFKEIDLLNDYEYLKVRRKGANWYNKINISFSLSKKLHLHLSTGATYSEDLLIENAWRSVYKGKRFHNLISPDFSIGLDWRMYRWLSFHSSISYGSTFIYLDNVPRKYQFTYGFCIKPFNGKGPGFLRTFHVELASIFCYFPDAGEIVFVPLPVFPFLYWQWGGNRNYYLYKDTR